jgi:hypothetical protein
MPSFVGLNPRLMWSFRAVQHWVHDLIHQPIDADEAVVAAWHTTADELPGIRKVFDHQRNEPADDATMTALEIARAKERMLLAAMAGRAGTTTGATLAAGRALEERARASYRPTAGFAA